MNRITKVLSSLVAAVTLAVSVGSVASAITYDPCDVNHDGVVNVRDAATVKKFLVGNLCEPEYNRLDTNKSLTIDDQDYQCVMAKIMGKTYSSKYYSNKNKNTSIAPNVSTYKLDDTANLLSPRTYRKFSYNTDTESTYMLYPSNNMLLNNVTKKAPLRCIVNEDDRYLARGLENTGIVRITSANEAHKGTGFIVDDHVIATCAHLLYKKPMRWLKKVGIQMYNENGTLSGTTLTPLEVHIPNDYISDTNDEITKRKYDYALITVKEDLSEFVHFSLGNSYNVTTTEYSNIPLHVTGCPKTTPNSSENNVKRLYTGEGRVHGENNTTQLHYDCDTVDGNSGSPVYTVTENTIGGKKSKTYTAIAIHAYRGDDENYNYGALVTKYLTQFYLSNPNINY